MAPTPVTNSHTCSANHPTASERFVNNQLSTPPMIPGNASKAFNPSFFSNSRIDRFLRVYCIQSFTPPLPGVGDVGGVGVGMGIGLTLATIEATMVLIVRLIALNVLTIVTHCSLNKVYIFLLNLTSFSNILLNVSLILLI